MWRRTLRPAASPPPCSAPGLQTSRAATGRVNLLAAQPGLLRADRGRIDALNAIDEAVTVATLPDATPVAAGEMVATIKIIPFALAGATLAEAEAACAGGAMEVLPWQARRVGLVLTTLPGLKPSIIEGTVAATHGRVKASAPSCCRPCNAHTGASRSPLPCVSCSPTVLTCCSSPAPLPSWTGAMSARPASWQRAATSCISACRSILAT